MEFEQCEIRANKSGSSMYTYYEFVAHAVGPHGGYIVARTPQFPAEEHMRLTSYKPFHFQSFPDEPAGNHFQRQFFDALVDHLVRTGWEPLAGSGLKWYGQHFRRHVGFSDPDPAPATPYTLGDVEAWREKALKLVDQYERHPDATSCRKVAEAFMQLGLALERERRFKQAYQFYVDASLKFKEIALPAEAAKASRWAERVGRRK